MHQIFQFPFPPVRRLLLFESALEGIRAAPRNVNVVFQGRDETSIVLITLGTYVLSDLRKQSAVNLQNP